MKYYSTVELAEKWGISSRRIGVLCEEGRIPGAQKIGRVWMIPENARKPVDARVKSGRFIKPSFKEAPLSKSQEGIYLECTDGLHNLTYNLPFLARIDGFADPGRFRDAVQAVIDAHPCFSVRIVPGENGEPIQRYTGEKPIIETVSLTDEEFLLRRHDFMQPFEIDGGPLCRFVFFHTPSGVYFLMEAHHIIYDGYSGKLFCREVSRAYRGEALAPEEYDGLDAALDECAALASDEYRRCEAYFDGLLADCDPDCLPQRDCYESEPAEDRLCCEFRLDPLSFKTLRESAGVSTTGFFTAAMGLLLARYNDRSDSVFTTVYNGRDEKNKDTFSMFVKTLPFVTVLNDDETTAAFLTRQQKQLAETRKHALFPFTDIAQKYGVTTALSFGYQGKLLDFSVCSEPPIPAEMLRDNRQIESSSFIFEVTDKDNGCYEIEGRYRRDRYTKEFAEGFARAYIRAVEGLLNERTVGDISLNDAESDTELARVNATERDYDAAGTVVDQFRRQAALRPDAPCVVFRDKTYTYGEIDSITDRLAKHLVKNGIGKETVVGILIPRGEYMPICAMGVLKAGGCYMPLDPSYPPERLNLMMSDSGAVMLITTRELSSTVTDDFKGTRLFTEEIAALPDNNLELPRPAPHDLFVLLYTSGSTGTPKGVMYEHGNPLVTSEWVKRHFGIGPDSVVAAYASYGFDAHAFECYPALTSGAVLDIIPEEVRLDLLALREHFNRHGVTVATLTTQIARQVATLGGFTTLVHLSAAGEKLTPLELPGGFRFHNLYGPTEGSICSSAFEVDRYYPDIPIGKPTDNLKVYIVDGKQRLQPVGAAGELWIAGPHVTRGYLNRPEKTAEAYGSNPFSKQKGYERVYRTGDVVRLLHDGNLQFIGRHDAQVKVRGFRIELTEVEEVIRRFEGITDATVAAFDDPAGGKFVAAYLVSDQPVDTAALAAFIRAEKPPYMVPAVLMQIDRIPLTQNGKVNRRALPLPERRAVDLRAPENETQKTICDRVAEAMGHSAFGIETDLYEAGLTSIGTVKLNVSLSKAFGKPVTIADLKENNTVLKLERFLAGAPEEEEAEILADYPLTGSQNGILADCLAAPGSTVYNIPVLFRLNGAVDCDRLARAVETAVDAHPAAKARLFRDANGDVRMARRDGDRLTVERIRCDILPERLLRPFDLFDAPLARIELYKTADGNYLFMDFHHIICDGTAEAVLLRDIDTAYAGGAVEREHYSAFEAALDEDILRKGPRYDQAKAYYETLLTGCDPNALPPKAPEAEAGAGHYEVTGELSAQAVRQFCGDEQITLNAFWNALFGFVLTRFTFKEETVFTTVYHGRNDSRLAETFGMLVKTLPVTVAPDGKSKVADYIRAVQEQLIGSMANDLYSFAEAARAYGVRADLMLVYQGDSFTFDSLGGYPAALIPLASENAKMPLSVNVFLEGDRFRLTAEYRRDLYSLPFAASFLDALLTGAEHFLTAGTLDEVSLLSDAARASYSRLNDNRIPARDMLCHEMLEQEAAAGADRLAVISRDETLTFGQLNRLANRLAHALIARGAKPGAVIGLILERSKEVMIGEFGIMKAGGAFLPMLPSYPDDRIDYCLCDAESPFVVTTEAIRAERAALFGEGKSYRALTLEELLTEENEENPALPLTTDSLCYCIYTSGSTGTPKGVMIEHHNIVGMIETHGVLYRYYREDSEGPTLALSSISFDMSLYEILLPLCRGRGVLMATDEEIHNPLALSEQMVKYRVENMVCTPTFLTNMIGVSAFLPALAQIKTVVCGGEAFPVPLLVSLRELAPTLQICNGYGPTECTVCCSMKELEPGTAVTIGRPSGNNDMFVADRAGNILPPYASGELIIGGSCVGRGYVKLPEKNAASFPLSEGKRVYRSGDLVRLNRDCEIEFSGRIDNQVKLRGFRVELDEIENVICSYEGVTGSKVIVRNNGSEDYLAGFYTADRAVDPAELTAYLKSKLTYYMVPAVLMQLDAMPLTAGGKIDKNRLPETVRTAGRDKPRRAAKKSLEQKLCDLFGSILNLEEYYADDDFFEQGGTSLSASKITMALMSDGIKVEYGDIFDHPTPEDLALFIESRQAPAAPAAPAEAMPEEQDEALRYNTVAYAPETKREPLGNVLLTGGVGYLGIHILKELIDRDEGHIYCLLRKGEYESLEVRLKAMMMYYFGTIFEQAIAEKITLIDADVTDDLTEPLADVPFDTVINCAACVKHFAADDVLERINVRGVENLIAVCRLKNARMVQISTVSIPGIHTPETYAKHLKMHENELFVIDPWGNKYVMSKYHAEQRVLDAVRSGMRGKIIRVGNLMGRHSDGEFQANFNTNMFMAGIKGFATMGMYPITHMTDPMSFSPVDCTAKAVVLLAGTNDKFTAFNCANRYSFDEMKIIDACNRVGLSIKPAEDEIYYEAFNKKLGDSRVNGDLNGLAAYDRPDVHMVETDNLFTTHVLYRLGFAWPLVEDAYLDKVIRSLYELGFFDPGEIAVED